MEPNLVQEWTSAHPHVFTLTVFNGHLYSGGQDSNKIQKWDVRDIEPLSLRTRLTRNRKMELLNEQSELEEAVVKYIEDIEQQETKNETEYMQREIQNEGKHLQEMQKLQQNFQEGMQKREQDIQKKQEEIQKMQEEMEKFQQTYQKNKTEKEQAHQKNKMELQQTRETEKTSVKQRLTRLEEKQNIIRDNIQNLEYSNPQNPQPNPQMPVKDEFFCPITTEIMKDPVIDNEGISYEREAIEEWLRRGNTRSPCTKKTLQLSDLRPNIALRKSIEEWQQENRNL